MIKLRNAIALSILFVCESALSCSCIFPFDDLDRSHTEASYVFIAEHMSAYGLLSPTRTKHTFAPVRVLKGEQKEKIAVWSAKPLLACGRSFSRGKNYVVYAYEEGGKLYTSRCSSWEISEFGTATEEVTEYYDNQ
jgi:hypothetical protein